MKLTNFQVAYLAGFVDADGCISITKRTDKEYKRGHSFYCNVRIVNTNKEMIEWVKERTELGSIQQRTDPNPRHKVRYEWKISGQNAFNLCVMLQPFLRVKAEQAKILIEFHRLKKDNHKTGRNGVPKEKWDKMEALRDRISRLNKRGTTIPT